jgi:DNA-binding IclR family transcriptional regulator
MALAAHRLIEQEPKSRRYRLGAGLSRLARIRDAHFPFVRLASPVIRELSLETGETVHLSEFSAGALLTLHVELSAKANRVNVDVGQVLPLHGTASGIAFLAASRLEAVGAYLEKPLQAFTAFTMTQPDDLVKAIALAASRGYSRSAQGYEEGVHSIGAAILGADGQPIGTLAVASPVSRVDDATAVGQGEAAVRAARLISARLTGEA